MLHIINSFPIASSFFEVTNSGDTVIFTENAVLAVKNENFKQTSLPQQALRHINLYVRKADLLLRNISCNELFQGVVIIDDWQYENAIAEDGMIKSCN